MVRRRDVEITTDAEGAATAVSSPITGEVLEIRYNGTTLNNETKADYTITRLNGGGTVLKLTNQDGPWQFAPRQSLHTNTGGTLTHEANTAAAEQVGPIPVDGGVQVVVAEGAASKTDTLHVFVSE